MFEARRRTAVDGKTWWVVFDTEKQKYSTLLCFGKYKTKEKYENKKCFYCGHSEKENHTMKRLDKELRKIK